MNTVTHKWVIDCFFPKIPIIFAPGVPVLKKLILEPDFSCNRGPCGYWMPSERWPGIYLVVIFFSSHDPVVLPGVIPLHCPLRWDEPAIFIEFGSSPKPCWEGPNQISHKNNRNHPRPQKKVWLEDLSRTSWAEISEMLVQENKAFPIFHQIPTEIAGTSMVKTTI